MDQFSAHLDRGWDLVQRGDTRGAEASARRALEIDPHSPEAYNLLGFVAALEGEGEEAVEAYRQAIALDETYLEAMLNAAEVYIHPLQDFEQAIEMCDQALNLAELDEEVIDALLLKFDAYLAAGSMAEASKVMARIPAGPYGNPSHSFLVGRAFYELGQVDKAAALIEETASKDPRHAEAFYYLGLIRDERGDHRGATNAFLRSRELDLEMGMPPWAPSRDAFESMTRALLEGLPPQLRQYVDAADIYIADVPGLELVADGVDPRALVLIDGSPPPEAPRPAPPPDGRLNVFIYGMNVARISGGIDTVSAEIEGALQREILAAFIEPVPSEPVVARPAPRGPMRTLPLGMKVDPGALGD